MRNPDLYLSDERWLEALQRMRMRVDQGVPLEGYDDTTIGAKNTQMSLGMCYQGPEFWPREDRLWPEREPIEGTVSPKYSGRGQLCPLDRRTEETAQGCFWSCRFFQRKPDEPRLTGKRVLQMYDEKIKERIR